MSFPVVCPGCGAPSGPSAGVCPFCKTTLSNPRDAKGTEHPKLADLRAAYRAGNLPRALALVAALEKEKPKLLEGASFLVLAAKILFEAEAATSRILSLLTRAMILEPDHAEAEEYVEIIEAKGLLTRERNDFGERRLQEIIRRSPKNPHAHFALGSHLTWSEGAHAPAAIHLEKCVSLHPGFLRAWGCLGVAYERIGNPALASKAFRECLKLETDPAMKKFFAERLAALQAAGAR